MSWRNLALSAKILVGLLTCLVLFSVVISSSTSARAASLADLWRGAAHFEQVGEIDWTRAPHGDTSEESTWITVRNGTWYAFSRTVMAEAKAPCSSPPMGIVVRASRDQGKSWSDRVVAAAPGDSGMTDGCAVLDGSTYFDAGRSTWHMLAQCLGKVAQPRWALCHYVRKAASPLGRFVADPGNPVVKGGALWTRICTGAVESCPKTTVDEGTPQIVSRTGGRFLVTFHGFDPVSGRGFRGAATTADFHDWAVRGEGLPGMPILGSRDCDRWLPGCVGVGAMSVVSDGNFNYAVVETMDKSLMCLPTQQWVFQLLRAPAGKLPASGSGIWQRLSSQPLLTPSAPDPATLCKVQYARWIVDDKNIFLIYEDWSPGRQKVHRRLLKLVLGKGRAVQLH